jgi:nitrogen fixation/metabolism regulation signal transduction histidine kinase
MLLYIYIIAELTFLAILFIPIIIYIIYSLFKHIDTTNRELSRFLLGLIHSDFSQSFYRKASTKSFNELYTAFNEVIQKFQKIRIDREEHYQYLLTVMQHVGIGLIAIKENGEIDFINDAAKKLLRIKFLNKVVSLNRLGENFGNKLLNTKNGERKTIELLFEDDSIQIVIYARQFKLRNEWYKLISLQDIKGELEEKEMDAWQKLIRVLTHEIMNSVTPISSLAGTVNTLLSDSIRSSKKEDDDTINDIRNAITTIKKRSDGLINFVEKYRSLTKIPKPEFINFPIDILFNRLINLKKEEIQKNNIQFTQNIKPLDLHLYADQDLLEQVLLNLIINSIHALKPIPNPKIYLSAFKDITGRVNIIVKDNGPGISKEIKDKIFIPFFSTKQSGSGIGLSLSRQIMKAHQGSIKVNSKPGVETFFTLRF